MLRLRTAQASKIRSLFEVTEPVLSEVELVFTKEGLKFSGSNHSVHISARINASSCDLTYTYTFSEPNVKLGISLKALNNILSCISPSDEIEIVATRESINSDRPHATVRVICANNYEFISRIHLLLIEIENMECPKQSFECCISMSSTSFLRTLRFLSRSCESIQIYTREGRVGKEKHVDLIMRAESDDSHTVFKERVRNKNARQCLKLDRYSLKALHLMSKGSSLCAVIEIFLKRDDLLAVKLKVGTIGSVIFLLSPNVESAVDCPSFDGLSPQDQDSRMEKPATTCKRPVKKRKKRVESRKIESSTNE
jgi:hypothetical protein